MLSVCAWISIPTPVVPFTLQTFGAFFLFYFFGGKKATASILVYMALGAVGIPVFSGFGSGIGVLFGPTGGYIFGFVVSGCLYIASESIFGHKPITGAVASVLALLACYAVGSAWAMRFADNGSENFFEIFIGVVCLFGIPDCIKIVFAYIASKHIKRIKIT